MSMRGSTDAESVGSMPQSPSQLSSSMVTTVTRHPSYANWFAVSRMRNTQLLAAGGKPIAKYSRCGLPPASGVGAAVDK